MAHVIHVVETAYGDIKLANTQTAGEAYRLIVERVIRPGRLFTTFDTAETSLHVSVLGESIKIIDTHDEIEVAVRSLQLLDAYRKDKSLEEILSGISFAHRQVAACKDITEAISQAGLSALLLTAASVYPDSNLCAIDLDSIVQVIAHALDTRSLDRLTEWLNSPAYGLFTS